ncbi:hypothetical protein EMELA_v1c04650 [Mesoplasma melaleucae]|uniref:Uncharacterized protein n=2 Tax=Mesoplasma melaleucae TaxID=81459 RepID=A0A2K8NXV7_9MOLU|nr:hypothetical protein EMELA_v1c04650 [Mesoplasma melaleucae]
MILKIINIDLISILVQSRKFMSVGPNNKNIITKKDYKADEEKFWKIIEDLRIKLLKRNDLKILCLFSQNFISTDEIFNLLNISKELRKS